MKNTGIAALVGTLLIAATAQADYQCVDYGGEVTMSVNEDYFMRLGNTLISLKSGAGQSQYFGFVEEDDGLLLKKKVFPLHPYKGDTLTIVSKPQSCGRGSCDYDMSPIITASLKIGDTQTYFTCDEIEL